MNLTGLDLDYLRRGLRGHPDVAGHVTDMHAIERMPARGLLALAKRLGVDPEAMVKATRERDHERIAHSTRHPAFRGTLNFDLTVELLGTRVARKARADYSYTPQWEYWDLRKQSPYVGWPGSGLCITIRTVPDKDLTPDGRPSWEKIDIVDITEVWDILDEAIEAKCRVEDAKRRRAAARGKGCQRTGGRASPGAGGAQRG
jgi:hypothetical protein